MENRKVDSVEESFETKKPVKSKMVILSLLVIAVVLVVGVVFFLMSKKESHVSVQPVNENITSDEFSETNPVAPSDISPEDVNPSSEDVLHINSTISELDSFLEGIDDDDFHSNELIDAQIGL